MTASDIRLTFTDLGRLRGAAEDALRAAAATAPHAMPWGSQQDARQIIALVDEVRELRELVEFHRERNKRIGQAMNYRPEE